MAMAVQARAMAVQARASARLRLRLPLQILMQRSRHLHAGVDSSSSDVAAGVAVETAPAHRPKKLSAHSSSFSRLMRRIQIAYDRIRFKALPPQLRDIASSASANAIRSETDLMNVVEQRIWHSVIEGDFEQLPGQGKPLKLERNPHMDPAEDLAYRILHQNGFAPEWVELNKEIRFHMERWRRALRLSWKRKADPLGGDAPRQEEIWRADLKYLEEELNQINKKVFHYNLIVPFGRQVFRYKIEEELRRVQNAE